MKQFLFMLLYCRKPPIDEEDVVENQGAKPDSSQPLASNAVMNTQPGSIEMVVIVPSSMAPAVPENTTASPLQQLKPSMNPSSPAVPQAAFRLPLSASSENARPMSLRPSSQNMDIPSATILSPDEMDIIQAYQYRRLKRNSAVSRVVARPLSGAAHDCESSFYPDPSAPPHQPHGSITPDTSSTRLSSSHQPGLHVNARLSQSSVTLDPLLNVAPGLLSPSSL
ncbi:hypothetical protein BS17DRAFT_383813 [Gyrodon lividus]|nr:hypothetical protein BS17DRAFT_383813 [Gyrodon lividus]